LGHEVTPEEFHARTGVLAGMRRDHVDDGLIAALVPLRYLDLTNTIQRAWEDPEAWVSGIVARYQVAFIDPPGAVRTSSSPMAGRPVTARQDAIRVGTARELGARRRPSERRGPRDAW
jgi:hypothetical protein